MDENVLKDKKNQEDNLKTKNIRIVDIDITIRSWIFIILKSSIAYLIVVGSIFFSIYCLIIIICTLFNITITEFFSYFI